jgi:hypothetical protein
MYPLYNSCVTRPLGFEHYTPLEEVKTRAAIALAFQQFQAINLPFQLAIVPYDR